MKEFWFHFSSKQMIEKSDLNVAVLGNTDAMTSENSFKIGNRSMMKIQQSRKPMSSVLHRFGVLRNSGLSRAAFLRPIKTLPLVSISALVEFRLWCFKITLDRARISIFRI